jgi:probable rRNA maturation factor
VLEAEQVAPEVEVEIVLANEATVRNLNRLYRGKDEPTDVLSFGAEDSAELQPVRPEPVEGRVRFVEPPDAEPSLGEVIICVPVAEQQARDQSHAVSGPIAHLLVHGVLHLLGYDHEESEAASALMKSREDTLLSALGYSGAYEHGH